MTKIFNQVDGYLVLQHHDPQFDIGARAAVYACRLGEGGPKSSIGAYGENVMGQDTRGDILNARLWRANAGNATTTGGSAGRDMPGWSFCMPTVVGGVRSGIPRGDTVRAGWDGETQVLAYGSENANGFDTSAPKGFRRVLTPEQRGLKRVSKNGWALTTGYRTVSPTSITALPTFAITGSLNQFTSFGARSGFSSFYQPAARYKSSGGGAANNVLAWMQEGSSTRSASSGYHSSGGPTVTEASPIRRVIGGGLEKDQRFGTIGHLGPAWDSQIPSGMRGIALAGTEEFSQEEIWLQTDGRLVAPGFGGPPRMGTLVADVVGGEMSAGSPAGLGGRQAFLQTMMRVVRMPSFLKEITHNPGNSLAWLLTSAEQGGTSGHGLVFGRSQNDAGSSKSPGRKPVVTPSQTTAEIMASDLYQGALARARASGGAFDSLATISTIAAGGFPSASGLNAPKTLPSIGLVNKLQTTKAPKESNDFSGGQTTIGMMGHEAGGPLSPGFYKDDVHNLGSDKDGNPINSGQITTKAIFSRSVDNAGPLMFSRIDYPRDVDSSFWGFKERVFLSWKQRTRHSHPTGWKDGKWDWWVNVPYIFIEDDDDEREPTDPYPPGRPPPEEEEPEEEEPEPVITGGGSTFPGIRPPVKPTPIGIGGGGRPNVFDRNLSGSGDSGIAFMGSVGQTSIVHYPQSVYPNAPDFRFARQTDEAKRDELVSRPAVLRTEAYGMEPDGRWIHTTKPGIGRVRGGIARGGVFDMPPEFDMFNVDGAERPGIPPVPPDPPDIVSFSSVIPTTQDSLYRGMVPGVWSGSGYPDTSNGDMIDGSFRHGKDPDSGNWTLSTKIGGQWQPSLVVRPGSGELVYKSFLLQSPNGNLHRVAISDTSVLEITDIGPPA
ncbi:MAG: hypothetical protein DRH30_00940 [Deltaproteobacteria bacterium]|nr:MAG: hypothetical protein DRH30_00940 [Deltaproteobacteria bacterium]